MDDRLLRKVASELFDAGAILTDGPYTLVSGKQSPFYVDLRRVYSYPQAFKTVVECMDGLLSDLPFDRVVPVPRAADPFGGALVMMGLPMLLLREPKEHGTGHVLEGAFEPGMRAVVLDDLITSATSKLAAIEALEGQGLAVRHVVVLVDREEGGRCGLGERGYQLHSAATMLDIVKIGMEEGKLEKRVGAKMLEYFEEVRSK